MCEALEEVAKQVDAKSIQAGEHALPDGPRHVPRFAAACSCHTNMYLCTVAIAYVMQKAPFVFPIIGGRKKEQLEANIEALDVKLSEEQIKYLEGVLPFDPGFPNAMVVRVACLFYSNFGGCGRGG